MHGSPESSLSGFPSAKRYRSTAPDSGPDSSSSMEMTGENDALQAENDASRAFSSAQRTSLAQVVRLARSASRQDVAKSKSGSRPTAAVTKRRGGLEWRTALTSGPPNLSALRQSSPCTWLSIVRTTTCHSTSGLNIGLWPASTSVVTQISPRIVAGKNPP